MSGTTGLRGIVLPSASAIASAAGCIRLQWKGALTVSFIARRMPFSGASLVARSMAVA
jgi:hypothetical protein